MKKMVAILLSLVLVLGLLPTAWGAESVTTFEELEKAVANGGNIVLGADIGSSTDIAATRTLYVAKEVTLDLNGYTLYGPHINETNNKHLYAFIVEEGGTLTVTDTSDAQTGEIKCHYSGIETKGGTFILDGGKITAKDASYAVAIVNYGGAVVINDGIVTGYDTAISSAAYFTDTATTEVNGGQINMASGKTTSYYVFELGGTYNTGVTSVTVNGGTVNSNEVYFAWNYEDAKATVEVVGGVFDTDVSDYLADGSVIEEKEDLYVVHKHTAEPVAEEPATCTEPGKTAGTKCSVCGEALTVQETVPAKGHTMTKTAAKAATCTEAGNIEYYTCSVCEKTFADAEGKKELTKAELVDPAKGHKVLKAEAKEATYTEAGNKEFYYCDTCKVAFADAEGKTALTESEIKALVIPQLIKVDDDKAEVSEGAVEVAIKEAAKDEDVTLDLTHKDVVGEENVDAVTTAELPVAALEAVAEEEKALTLVKEDATVSLDVKALEAVAEQAEGVETVTLKVESIKVEALAEKQQAAVKDKEVAVVLTAELLAGDKKIATKDGKGFGEGAVTVSVPVPAKLPEGVKAADLKVYYVADDGTVTEVKSQLKGDQIVFSLKHFSEYVIAAEKPASPATGDTMNIALYGALAIMSVLGMAVVLKKKAF